MDQTPITPDLDRIFDELEEQARGSGSTVDFLQSLLGRSALILQADSAAFLISSPGGQWQAIAATGSSSVQAALPASLNQPDAGETTSWWSSSRNFLAVPVRPGHWNRGALCFGFPVAAAEPRAGVLVELASAFAEILATRQQFDLDRFLELRWSGLQQLLGRIASLDHETAAATELVNGLIPVLGADRISLARWQGGERNPAVAISGVAVAHRKSEVVRELGQIAVETRRSGAARLIQPESGQIPSKAANNSSDQHTLPFCLAIPLHAAASQTSGGESSSTTTDRTARTRQVLVVEWTEREAFVESAQTLPHVLPAVATGWEQVSRWTRLPGWIRRSSQVSGGWWGRMSGWILNRLVLLGCLAALLFAANWPVSLRIEAPGTLQPVEQRGVFAALDGSIAELLVRDGQTVGKDQLLVRLRSPEIEQALEALAGERDQLLEQKRGLNLEVNQLSPDASDFALVQNRLSSEIRLLETKLEGLNDKQAFLQQQVDRLQIKAPVAGTVVANQLERFLDGRPVRRGDQLFRIVDFSGPWQLELMVADQDAGWIRRSFSFDKSPGDSGSRSAETAEAIDFVLASRPDRWWKANPVWIAPAARNPDGSGSTVEVRCSLDRLALQDEGQMGSRVYGYFSCGKQPFWFVWSRGIVESLQRRKWF